MSNHKQDYTKSVNLTEQEIIDFKKHKQDFYFVFDLILRQYEECLENNVDVNTFKLTVDINDYMPFLYYLIYKTRGEEYKLFYFDTVNGMTFEDITYNLHFYMTEIDGKDYIKIVLNNEFIIECVDLSSISHWK